MKHLPVGVLTRKSTAQHLPVGNRGPDELQIYETCSDLCLDERFWRGAVEPASAEQLGARLQPILVLLG